MTQKSLQARLALSGLLLAGLILALPAQIQAAQVAGVTVADSVATTTDTLPLRGAGLRRKYFLAIYVAALYTRAGKIETAALLQPTAPVTLELALRRELTVDKLYAALEEGLQPNLTTAEYAAMTPLLGQIRQIMGRAANPLQPNDRIRLDFQQAALGIRYNGKPLGAVDDAAARKLLLIWLGPHPVDGELKNQLLSISASPPN